MTNHWPIRTHQRQYPPAKFVFGEPGRTGMAIDSIVLSWQYSFRRLRAQLRLSPDVR